MLKDLEAYAAQKPAWFFAFLLISIVVAGVETFFGVGACFSGFTLVAASGYACIAALSKFEIAPGFKHRTSLFKGGIFGFSLRMIALEITVSIVAMLVLLFVFPALAFRDIYLAIGFFAMRCLIRPPVYALLGTWLPAGLAGEDASLSHAFRRGKIAFNLLYWNVLSLTFIDLISFYVILVFIMRLSDSIGVQGAIIVGMILITGLMNVTNCLLSFALTKSYLSSMGASSVRDLHARQAGYEAILPVHGSNS